MSMKTGRIKGRKISPASASHDRAGGRLRLAQSPREAQQFKVRLNVQTLISFLHI